LLELDGFVCNPLVEVDGHTVPLRVTQGNKTIAVGVQSGLLATGWDGHSLARLRPGYARRVLNDYILRRNLPDEHRLVSEALQEL